MTEPFKHLSPEDIFQNTTTSYKFFWSVALLNLHKLTNERVYECNDVVLRMICEAFFVLDNTKIYLGSTDHLRSSVFIIKKWYPVIWNSPDELYNHLLKDKDKGTVKRLVSAYKDNVPFRFLTPWAPRNMYMPYNIDKESLGDESVMFPLSAPYIIYRYSGKWMIKINPAWINNYKGKYNDLIDGVIGSFATYIVVRRNELSRDQYIPFLKNVFVYGQIVSLSSNFPDKKSTSSPSSISSSSSSNRDGSLISRITHSYDNYVPKEDVIHEGRITAIGDKELLEKIGPLVESNKLEAVKILMEHYSGKPGLNMTFKDWALLIETIHYDNSPTSFEKANNDDQSIAAHYQPISRNLVNATSEGTSLKSSKTGETEWEDVNSAFVGIGKIHEVFGSHEDFPTFSLSSIRLDDSTLSLIITAKSFKNNHRFLIRLLFCSVTYYHATITIKKDQKYRFSCKRSNSGFKYRIGDSTILIFSDKAQVLSINQI